MSYKIVDHISSEHTDHKHKNNHGHEHEHEKEHEHEHNHHNELSLLNVCMGLPSYHTGSFVLFLSPLQNTVIGFSSTELNLHSFSTAVFRPPIA